MSIQTDPFTYEYRDGSFATVGMEELFDRQSEHDDLRIRDRFIEYDRKNHGNVSYFTYILDKREDEGEWERYIKVVRLCKVYSVPKELREKKALMVSQDEMLSAIWKNDTNFICIYCNLPAEDKPGADSKSIKGFYYLYGVQCMMRVYGHFYGSGDMPVHYDEDTPEAEKIAQTLKALKREADAKYEGLLKVLRGTFRQARFFPLTMKEAEAIRSTIEEAPQLQVIRGIPKTHISAASGVTTSLDGVTTTPEGIEQNEEFIRGMLHDRYANVIMAVPIPHDEILQWSQNTAKELSRYKSQYSGMISHNAGVSIPMVFAGNLSATLGSTHGVTDTSGETLGVTQGTSESISHGTGTNQGTSHTVGYSQGQSTGIADSTSQSVTDSRSQGLSQSQSVTNSRGLSQTVSDGVTHGVTNTESLGRSHTIGKSETYGESESFSRSQSHSLGRSATMGTTFGETLGNTQGITTGNTIGQTHGNSLTSGQTAGDTSGHTTGTTQGHTSGITNGTTQGMTQGHTSGTTQGMTQGHTAGTTQGHTTGTTNGLTQGHTTGTTNGLTQGHTTGTTNGLTQGNTYGTTYGTTEGITTGRTVGNTQGTTIGTTVGHTTGTTIGDTTGRTITDGTTYGTSSSQGGSHTLSNGVSTSQSIGNSTSISQSVGHTLGKSATNSYGTSDSSSNTWGSSWNDGSTHTWNTGGTKGITDTHGNTESATKTHGFSLDASGEAGLLGNGGKFGGSLSNSFATAYGQTDSTGINNGSTWGESGGSTHSSGGSLGGSVSHGVTQSSSLGATESNSYSQGLSRGVTQSIGNGTSQSVSDGTSWSNGVSNSQSHSIGNSNSHSVSNSSSDSTSQSTSNSISRSVSDSQSQSLSHSLSNSQSQSLSRSLSQSASDSLSKSFSQSASDSLSRSLSQSNSDSLSRSLSHSNSDSLSRSASDSLSKSLSQSASDSLSKSLSNSFSNSNSNSLSKSLSDSMSHSFSQSLARGMTDSLSNAHSLSNSLSNSHSLSRSNSLSQGISEGWSEGVSHGIGRTHSVGATVSDGITQSVSRGISDSNSHTVANGVTHSQSTGTSVGRTDSLSHGQSTGIGRTTNQGLSRSLSDSTGVTQGTSNTDSRSIGTTNSQSNSLSNAQGISNARSSALGTGQGLNFSFGPTIGVSRSYQVFDEQKGNIIKLLEASNTRWLLASRMGAFHVDMYVLSYTPEAAQGIAMTAVSSWGGDNEMATVQCVTPDLFTQNHLMKHASVFDPCTMKENTPNIADNYLWSTIMLSSELAALTHLPRVETGGVSTVATNIPAFSIFANKTGEIYFGKQINYEDGMPSYDYFFSKKEFMHTLICGASGSGKTTSAVRMAREVIRNYTDMKIFALDWKNSWRVLKRFAPNGIDDFEFFGLDYTSVRPIKMNLFIPPKYVGATQWIDKVIESLCLGYGFGTKMFSVLKSAARISMMLNGILVLDNNGIPVEMKVASQAEQDEFNSRMAKVTLKQIYEIVQAMKEGALRKSSDLALRIAAITDSDTRALLESKFVKSGMGMQDAYDSILAKLEGYYSGELRAMYCEEDYNKCVHIEDLIDGKRIVVLEGGDLDSSTKKAVIELISHGLFMYSRLKKNRDKIVEKRFYILEEAHRIIDNPESGDAPPLNVGETIFDILLNEAREYGVYCMVIVQTPNALPPALITNCAILIIHRLGNDKDITLMTQMLCRNARLDNRDVPIWLAKEAIGTAIVRISNTVMHQDSEPCLVQVARCENEPPDNEELVLDMPDVEIPLYLRKRMNDDPYLDLYRDELEKFINHDVNNEIDAKNRDYHDYEIAV